MSIKDKMTSAKRKSRKDIEQQASETLRMHGLYSIPVDPVTLANKSGIKVHNAKFSDDKLSGMIAKRGDNISLLVNQADPSQRKRFTIAHELGHHFLHLLTTEDGEFVDTQDDAKIDLFRDTETAEEIANPDKRYETEANQFAAALLMPAEFVREMYHDTQSVSELSFSFNVSETAMAIRLVQLGLSR